MKQILRLDSEVEYSNCTHKVCADAMMLIPVAYWTIFSNLYLLCSESCDRSSMFLNKLEFVQIIENLSKNVIFKKM